MDSVKERIEKEAEESTIQNYNTSDRETNPYYKGYISGATAERNKAIEDCLAQLTKHRWETWDNQMDALEKLKL